MAPPLPRPQDVPEHWCIRGSVEDIESGLANDCYSAQDDVRW